MVSRSTFSCCCADLVGAKWTECSTGFLTRHPTTFASIRRAAPDLEESFEMGFKPWLRIPPLDNLWPPDDVLPGFRAANEIHDLPCSGVPVAQPFCHITSSF
ncbi:hypothetical protein BD626DRAFT_479877 [Schizophyllum amplum]|uniref:Uncharacterized protein n=1 Tax=Schizophyllum amplum TaxID=97359 RepID=A0A550CSQ1_9AGAR|nr:hypothetical protein BD626DRAFT_479877 [Auriculariopsis ampla]